MSERVLWRENETLKEYSLCLQEELDEWKTKHQKACKIMKNNQARINHLQKQNEEYKNKDQEVESIGAPLDQLVAVAAVQGEN